MQLGVEDGQFLVGDLERFVRGLYLFVGRLQLLPGGLQFFVERLELFVGGPELFDRGLECESGGLEFEGTRRRAREIDVVPRAAGPTLGRERLETDGGQPQGVGPQRVNAHAHAALGTGDIALDGLSGAGLDQHGAHDRA